MTTILIVLLIGLWILIFAPLIYLPLLAGATAPAPEDAGGAATGGACDDAPVETEPACEDPYAAAGGRR